MYDITISQIVRAYYSSQTIGKEIILEHALMMLLYCLQKGR